MMLFRVMVRHTGWVTWLQHALMFAAYVCVCAAFCDHLIAVGQPDVLMSMFLFVVATSVVGGLIYVLFCCAFKPLRAVVDALIGLRRSYVALANEIRLEDAKRDAQKGDISEVRR